MENILALVVFFVAAFVIKAQLNQVQLPKTTLRFRHNPLSTNVGKQRWEILLWRKQGWEILLGDIRGQQGPEANNLSLESGNTHSSPIKDGQLHRRGNCRHLC